MPTVADVVPLAERARAAGAAATATTGRTVGRTVTRTGGAVSDALGSLADAATTGVRAASRRLTDEPSGALDDWGRDPVLVRNLMLAAQLRWDVATGGDQHLPKRKGALIVVNSPQFMLTPVFAAFAISEAIDRPVRFVGRPDGGIVGAFGRRIGGLLDDPDEVAGALRADQIVVMAAGRARGARRVGAVDHTLVGSAIATSTGVFPTASSSSPFGRSARIEIGRAVRPPRSRRGPLAELELADRLHDEIESLLDEMGDISGTPVDWLPFGGMGSH